MSDFHERISIINFHDKSSTITSNNPTFSFVSPNQFNQSLIEIIFQPPRAFMPFLLRTEHSSGRWWHFCWWLLCYLKASLLNLFFCFSKLRDFFFHSLLHNPILRANKFIPPTSLETEREKKWYSVESATGGIQERRSFKAQFALKI